MPRDGAPDRRSGVDEYGDWSPAFPSQRRPLAPGHTVTTHHGGYSVVALQPRAREIAEQLLESLPEPVAHPRFAAMVDLAASALARHEAAVLAAEQETDPDRAARLDVEASRWWRNGMSALKELALTPAALAALGVDLAAALRGPSIVTELQGRARTLEQEGGQ